MLFVSAPNVGCTLTLEEPVRCVDAADCRDAFGFGSSCADDGLCTSPSFPSRCSRSFPEDLISDPSAYADAVLLGSLYSFRDHEDTLLASELAIRQANEAGGLDGLPIAIVHCDYTENAGDDLNDIEAIEEIAPYLADTLGVPAIVGPRGSSRSLATFAAVSDSGTLVISPSATSPLLTSAETLAPSDDTPGLLWRTAPPDTLQGLVIAEDMLSRGVSQVAVLYQAGAYGEGLSTLFSSTLSAGGGVVSLRSYTPGADFSLDVALIADGIEAGTVDEVLVISSDITDYTTFFQSASATVGLRSTFEEQLGDEESGIFLSDTAYSTSLLEDTVPAARPLFAKVRGSRPAPAEGLVFNTFSASYRAEFGVDSTGSAFAPHSYDAAWMVLYGAAWAYHNGSSIEGITIARGLRRLSAGTPVDLLMTSWSTAQAELAAGSPIDIRGASGQLDYDPSTEETSSPIEVWSISVDGETYAFERERLVEVED